MYELASEQLSVQDHYDFGMRAVKLVLTLAGQLKRQEPDTKEELLLLRAMKESNLPKFIDQDAKLFTEILSDLFPQEELPSHEDAVLQSAIEKQLERYNLTRVKPFVDKIFQLRDLMRVRHGIIVIGPTGAGKSTAISILYKALMQIKREQEAGTASNPAAPPASSAPSAPATSAHDPSDTSGAAASDAQLSSSAGAASAPSASGALPSLENKEGVAPVAQAKADYIEEKQQKYPVQLNPKV